MYGEHDACDHRTKGFLKSKKLDEIPKAMKERTDAIPHSRTLLVSVQPEEIWSAEIGVLKISSRKNFEKK